MPVQNIYNQMNIRFFQHIGKLYLPLYFVLLIVCFSNNEVYAQEKMEKEYGIKESIVPQKAHAFVHATYAGAKIKWYKEENLNGFTIEAKLKWEGKRHSVEFDTLGKLQDIEITVGYQTLNDTIRNEIDKYLSNTFRSFKINKTQLQLMGSDAALQAWILNGVKDSIMVRKKYELVIEGKRNGDKIKRFYELLIDDDGNVIHQLKIIERRVNHLIF